MSEPARASYSIAAVSKLTGVSCHALRVWERRYGFPGPLRSPSGHRRYPSDQVAALQEIARCVHNGRPIGEVITDYREGRIMPSSDLQAENPGWTTPIDELLERLFDGDFVAAESVFEHQAKKRTPIELIRDVLWPALVDSGERWFRKECEAFQERSASGFLLRKLSALVEQIQNANQQGDRTVLVGAVQGDRHEGGVLCLCAALESAGWRAVSLGVDLPVREYQKAIDRWRPDALILSFTLSRNIKKRFAELSTLRGAPVIVGGRSILNYQGLARRHGLIALNGPATAVIDKLQNHCQDGKGRDRPWSNGHS